jgi:hypothetical protein
MQFLIIYPGNKNGKNWRKDPEDLTKYLIENDGILQELLIQRGL